MDVKHGLEALNEFKAINYHGIEYRQSKNESLYMRSCGIQRCLSGYSFGPCAREGYHLHVVLSGKGVLEVGGREYQIHEGQMFLIKEMEETYYQADHEDPWYYVWVTFGGASAKQHMEYAGFGDGEYVRDSAIDSTEFFTVVKEIIGRPHFDTSSEVFRKSQALCFLSLAIESREKQDALARRKTPPHDADYVDYAVDYIRGNYSHARISDVVKYIGVSRSHFTTIFKRKMMMSPQEFLMQVRMNKSKELLTQTEAPVYLVAKEVGYEDQLTFSKVFKKKFGLSPEQYRKRHHDEHSV